MIHHYHSTFHKQIWIVLTMVIAMFFSIGNSTDAKDYSENHTYKSNALKELIEIRVHNDNYDIQEAQQMIDRIGLLPEKVIKRANKAKATLIFMDFPLTELKEFESLKGKTPRGWEGTGLTWDDVPGAGGYTSAARIGYSAYGTGHTAINLELHEFSHGIDSFLKNHKISDTTSFKKIHQEEKRQLFKGITYFDYTEEYFAETMAYYYLGNDSHTELKIKAPKTFKFIQQLDEEFGGIIAEEDRIPDTPSDVKAIVNDVGTISISWNKVEEAIEYIVFRNGKQIATTSNSSYTDKNVKHGKQYYYSIIAKNAFNQSSETKAVDIMIKDHPSGEDNAPSATPATPKNVLVVPNGPNAMLITWDKVKDSKKYIILRNDLPIMTTTENAFIDRKIKRKTTYTYSVIAVNKYGTASKASKTVTITTKNKQNNQEVHTTKPDTPTNLIVEQPTIDTVKLNWDKVKQANEYIVLRDGKRIHITSNNSYVDNQIKEGTTYHYSIIAVNDNRNSLHSNETSITTSNKLKKDPTTDNKKSIIYSPERKEINKTENEPLPSTSTSFYKYILIGLGMLVISIIFFLGNRFMKRRNQI